MFTANLEDYKIKQDEMIRQAKAYRLAKLSAGTSVLISSIVNLVSKLIGPSEQQLLTFTEVNR